LFSGQFFLSEFDWVLGSVLCGLFVKLSLDGIEFGDGCFIGLLIFSILLGLSNLICVSLRLFFSSFNFLFMFFNFFLFGFDLGFLFIFIFDLDRSVGKILLFDFERFLYLLIHFFTFWILLLNVSVIL
jgi:hypothetical protein